MSNQASVASAVPLTEPKRLACLERYLTVRVLGCIVVGVAFGKLLPDVTASLGKLEFGQGSQVTRHFCTHEAAGQTNARLEA